MRRSGVIHSQNLKQKRFFKDSALFVGVGFLFALFYVWTRVQVVETGYQIRHLMTQAEELKGQNHALRVEVATLKSPVRLDVIALNLGLKRPPEKQVTMISSRSP